MRTLIGVALLPVLSTDSAGGGGGGSNAFVSLEGITFRAAY